jgi:hypothetical protein
MWTVKRLPTLIEAFFADYGYDIDNEHRGMGVAKGFHIRGTS